MSHDSSLHDSTPAVASSRQRQLPWALALACYLALTAIYAWPVLRGLGTTLPSDMGDTALNTWILWWDAQALPLTARWWNAPMFYPAMGAFGLSETMLSVALVTSPLQWAGLTAVDGWSARWEGAIIPRFTESYTLSIAADDGVRVWIDGVQKN